MAHTLLKWLITVVMTLNLPITGIIYWGATQLTGKLSIVFTGLLVHVVLAFWYSWLNHRPKSVTDWLDH